MLYVDVLSPVVAEAFAEVEFEYSLNVTAGAFGAVDPGPGQVKFVDCGGASYVAGGVVFGAYQALLDCGCGALWCAGRQQQANPFAASAFRIVVYQEVGRVIGIWADGHLSYAPAFVILLCKPVKTFKKVTLDCIIKT